MKHFAIMDTDDPHIVWNVISAHDIEIAKAANPYHDVIEYEFGADVEIGYTWNGKEFEKPEVIGDNLPH